MVVHLFELAAVAALLAYPVMIMADVFGHPDPAALVVPVGTAAKGMTTDGTPWVAGQTSP
jgi:hypothetical protein